MALRSHSAKSPGVHAPLASASMQDACNSVVVESKTRNHIRERQAPVDEAAGHAEASSCDSRAPETATCAHMPHFGGDSTAASRPPNEEDAAMDSPVDEAFPSLPSSRGGHTKSRKQMVCASSLPWTPCCCLQINAFHVPGEYDTVLYHIWYRSRWQRLAATWSTRMCRWERMRLQVSPRRSMTADWQPGIPNIAHHNPLAAVYAQPAIQSQHVRATRVLPHANEADVEMRTQKGDSPMEAVTCVESSLPASPATSMDRLSACSNSSKGNRKVMALHPTHGSMREGPNHSTSSHQLHPHGKFGGGPGHLLQAQRVWDHAVRDRPMLLIPQRN